MSEDWWFKWSFRVSALRGPVILESETWVELALLIVADWSVFNATCLCLSSVRQSGGGGVDRSSLVDEEVNNAADDSLQTDRGERFMPYGFLSDL